MQIIFEDSDHRVVSVEDSAALQAEIRKLQHYAFSLEHYQADPESTKPKQSDLWPAIAVIDKDDKVVASIDITNQDIYLKGRTIGHGGLGGVCSYPETRRQGNIRKAMRGTLMYLKDKGMAVSGLYPFKFSFYRQFGWELGQKEFLYSIPIRELGQFKGTLGTAYRCRFGQKEDIGSDCDRLIAMYADWAPKYGAAFRRTKHWWVHNKLQGVDKKRFACIYTDKNGKDAGYMIYTFDRNDKVSELRAEEIVYKDTDALKGILSFVFSHDSMVRDFKWRTPIDIDLLPLLEQPRVDVKIETGMMFRVVDVRTVLDHLAKDYAGPRLNLIISDDTAEWNHGLYTISESGSVEGPYPLQENEHHDCVRFSIQRFSQAVCGYAPVRELISAGLIEADEGVSLSDLDKLFRLSETYCAFMNDHF